MKYDAITQKKEALDAYRPLPPALTKNLEGWFRVELTYTSNAIEGNTLTRQETAVVLEKGLTVGGKSLTEHLEATNHAKALDWVQGRITSSIHSLSEDDVLFLHQLILKGIDGENAGFYRSVAVRIAGSRVVLPNPKKVPDLMERFIDSVTQSVSLHPVEQAANAHYELVTIHPFIDGNGRTARLLMNLILMIHGYPPAIIRPRDRLKYLGALEKAQMGGSREDYNNLISQAVDRSLDIYLNAVSGKEPKKATKKSIRTLLKIGQLAKQANETTSTVRYWTKEGLLEIADVTPSGYHLYSPKMVKRIKQIQDLKAKRFSLEEIKNAVTSHH